MGHLECWESESRWERGQMKVEASRAGSGRTSSAMPRSEGCILKVMGRPLGIVRRIMTSLEELELWA